MMSAKMAPPRKTMCFLRGVLDTNLEFLRRKKERAVPYDLDMDTRLAEQTTTLVASYTVR
jgi:hypothetical protein